MKLIKTVEQKNFLVSIFAIYELNDEQTKKFGKRYAVSQGVFSKYGIEMFGEDDLIEDLKASRYEGLFETKLEAEQHIKIVVLEAKLEKLTNSIESLNILAQQDVDE